MSSQGACEQCPCQNNRWRWFRRFLLVFPQGGGRRGFARLCLQSVAFSHATRLQELGAAFPISVKVNSADFQRGGFDKDDAFKLATMLEDAGIDLIEVSGGTYEAMAMIGDLKLQKASTQAREAYFIEFAARLRSTMTQVPVMCTGGWRTRDAMLRALKKGEVDIIGLGRPLIEHDLPMKLMLNKVTGSYRNADRLTGGVSFHWCPIQFDRFEKGLPPDLDLTPWLT